MKFHPPRHDMHEHQPQQAIFIADALALDFLNSVATPVNEPVDSIDNGDGLLQWLEQAGLVPAETLATLRSQALPGELDAVAVAHADDGGEVCEGSRCTLIFADHTRGQRRRWCSTAVCGNRAKVAAHRQRKKEAGMR